MPLNVQLANAQVKDPQSGQMIPAGLIGSDAISTINTAKNQAVAAVQQKGVETLESIPDDYTALSNEVDEVKTQITQLGSEIAEREYKKFEKGDSILTYQDNSIAGSTGITSNNTYGVSYFYAPEDFSLYFDSQNAQYLRLTIYSGEPSSATFIANYSTSESEHTPLPMQNSPLSIKTGQCVAISQTRGLTNKFTFYQNGLFDGFTLNENIVLNDTQLAQIDNEFDINGIANKLNLLGNTVTPFVKLQRDYSGCTKFVGNASTSGLVSNSAYVTYYFAATKDFDLYVDPDNLGVTWGTYWTVYIYNGAPSSATYIENRRLDNNNLPTENDKLSVNSGYVVAITINNKDQNSDFIIYQNMTTSETFEIDEDVILPNVIPKITIHKVSNTEFDVIVPTETGDKSVDYKFLKYEKTWDSLEYEDAGGNTQTATNVKSSECWNNTQVLYDGVEIAQGNTNFICKVNGESGHIGDGHGNEVNLYLAFLADGVEFDIATISEDIECSVFKFIQRSNVYAYGGGNNTYGSAYPKLDTSGNPIINFQHNMEVTLNVGNKVNVDNRIVIKRNGISFEQCHGAMLESAYTNFDIIICNNSEGTRNIISNDGTITVPDDSTVNLRTSTSQKCDCVVYYGKKFYIKQTMEQKNRNNDSKSNVQFSFYSNRLKSYFQPVIATYGKQSGETEDIFNSGDYINVYDERIVLLT